MPGRHDNPRIGRRQAWQFAVVPLARHGDELEVLCTATHAARAMRFIERVLGLRPRVRLVPECTLLEALRERFPFEGGERAGSLACVHAVQPDAGVVRGFDAPHGVTLMQRTASGNSRT